MIELSAESEETVIVNITWWQRRTRLEKKLVIGVVFVAGVVLSFLIDAALHSQKEPPEVCNTAQCIIASSDILNRMDETVDPCNDFFKFACGKLSARTHHKDIPTESIKYQVKKQLTNILLEPINENDSPALNYEKNLFSACVNEATNGTSMKVLKSVLIDLGGWPVLMGGKWSDANFKWIELIDKLKDIGLYYKSILQAHLQQDPSETLETNITVISAVSLIYTDKHADLFKKLIIESAIALGAKEFIAIEEMTEVFEFLVKLNKLRSSNKNDTNDKPRLQILELQKNYSEIEWLKYLKLLLDPHKIITEHDFVVFPYSEFLTNFIDLMNTTNKRTLANYIFCTATISILPLVSNEFLELDNQFYCLKDMSTTDRMDKCRYAVYNCMNPIPSYLTYFNRHTPNSTRKKVKQMFDLISNELKKLIRSNTWMDTDSKHESIKWLETVECVIGLKAETVDNIYQKLGNPKYTNNAFILNYLKIRKQREIDKKTKNIIEMDSMYFQIPYTEILFFNHENAIILPAGILQGVYFDENRPMYMNYGSLGKAIGSVLVYTYTYTNNDDLHTKNDFWSKKDKKIFVNKSSCVSHNLEYFGDEGDNFRTPTYYKKHLKHAQIVGVKLAYNAYKIWVNKNGEELNLVGLNYTEPQIFWISSLADVCFEETDDTVYNYYNDNEVVRQNFDFAIDFHCDLDSNMNPSNKCILF